MNLGTCARVVSCTRQSLKRNRPDMSQGGDIQPNAAFGRLAPNASHVRADRHRYSEARDREPFQDDSLTNLGDCNRT